jgi:hypothetical protein
MAANPSIANLNLSMNAPKTVSEPGEMTHTSLLQRIEMVLRKAFGDDEETITNSLRGF